MKKSIVILIAPLILLTLLALPAAAQSEADDLVAAYRAFLGAVQQAESIDDLTPYFTAEIVARMGEAPEEALAGYLERLKAEMAEAPAGEWTVAERKVIGETAHLAIRGVREDGEVRRTLESSVRLRQEGETWKIEKGDPWQAVEVLPADVEAAAPPRPSGPGAERIDAGPFDPTAYELVASAEGSLTGGGTFVFDPQGYYVALSNAERGMIQLFELDGLREVASIPAPHAWGIVSFRSDGRAFAVNNGLSHVPEVVPVRLNLDHAPPEEGYFFSRPVLRDAAAAVPGRAGWFGLAYHPAESILALAVADHDDATHGALVFQPVEEGVWDAPAQEPLHVWPTEEEPYSIAWAPTGDRIAWTSADSTPGAPVHVRGYPEGEALTLSHPDLSFGHVLFGPGGRRVAGLGSDGEGNVLAVWDAGTGEELWTLPNIRHMAFAPDGEHLYVVRSGDMMIEEGVDDTILVWKIGAAEPTHAISAFPQIEGEYLQAVAGLAVSPNGRYLIAASEGGEVRLWEINGGA